MTNADFYKHECTGTLVEEIAYHGANNEAQEALLRERPTPRTLTGSEQLCNECAVVFDVATVADFAPLADHELGLCAPCIVFTGGPARGVGHDGLTHSDPYCAMIAPVGSVEYRRGEMCELCVEREDANEDPTPDASSEHCRDCGGYRAYVGQSASGENFYRCTGCGSSR